ncbi:MAG TPA: TonB-dependent receptor [Pyrinomonadaceae bacterium]|nr:TonB-dependent receptor [Pyrinomonadaceae bacterium]
MKTAIKLLLILCLGALPVLAQSNTGSLAGTVSDASGVIPGASVVVKDTKTAKERTVTASGDGTFNVPQLEPGTYTVTVTAAGHKAFTASDVKIDVGREYSLNPALEVGSISENVTIVAGTDVINSTNAELSNTVSPRQIQELPLNGRNPLALILLQAGTSSNGAQGTSINGQRPSATNITLDGLNIQDNFIRANASSFTQIAVSTDDVAEFTLTTQNAGGDQGFGASQVQLVTPRGANEFHGALFEYNRNSKFGANTFFNNAAGSFAPNDPLVTSGQKQAGAAKNPKTFRNFNQFGGRVSGPVLKNKLFFFFNYEGQRDRVSQSSLRTVLTPDARQGIFTYIDNGGVRRQINLFALPIANVSTPGAPPVPTAVNPLIQSRFLTSIPTGNSIEAGDQRNTTGYRFSQRADTDYNNITARGDYDLNSNNSINFIWKRQRLTGFIPDFADANGFTITPAAGQNVPGDSYVGAWRSTISPNLTNEVRAGYGHIFPGFPQLQTEPANFFVLPLVTNPESTFLFQGRDTKVYTLQDNADYLRGNHNFSFGVQSQFNTALRLNRGGVLLSSTLGVGTNTPQITTAQFGNAALFPGGIGNTDRTSANALFALLGGIVNGQAQTFNVLDASGGLVPGEGFRQDYAYSNYNFYFQDGWKVTPRLTLNLGLRYELWPSVRERNGVLAEVTIPSGMTVTQALLDPNGGLQTAGTNLGNGKLFKTDKNNFAPSLSFAYAPEFGHGLLGRLFPGEGRTVIRGGYRMSYVNDEFLKASSGEGDQNSGKRENANIPNLNLRADGVTAIATPSILIPRTFVQNNTRNAALSSVAVTDPNLQLPTNHEYTFGIQRNLGWKTALEIRYVGAKSNNMTRYTDVNAPDIINNGFLADFQRARANFALTGLFNCTTAQNAGCQALQVFPRLGTLSGTPGGIGSASVAPNATIAGLITGGTPGQLAVTYTGNFLAGSVPFQANPNIGLGLLLSNTAFYNYNALQVELRRSFSDGLYFQANYTFGKTLSNAPGTDQRRFEFQVYPGRDDLEKSRAQTDVTHVFNFNSIYELPFGKGKRFFTGAGSWLNRAVGGWQLGSIVSLQSGAPIGFFDPRGTFASNARSARNTANSNLSKAEIRALTGVFRTPCGVFFINPTVLNINQANLAAGNCSALGSGRGAEGFGSATFPGQVFFNVPPGEFGHLERFFVNGPTYFNVDASLIKNITIKEGVHFQIRAEVFNVLNRANFGVTAAQQVQNISSSNFGRLTTAFSPRVVQFAGRLEF